MAKGQGTLLALMIWLDTLDIDHLDIVQGWIDEIAAELAAVPTLQEACKHGLEYIIDLVGKCECADFYSGIQISCPQCELRAAIAKAGPSHPC